MTNNAYTDVIIISVNKLAEIRDALFDQIFNIVMAGELKEWSDTVEEGEVHEFSKEIFEGCSDVNIQLLTQLLTHVENSYHSLLNLNNLKLPTHDMET